MDAKIVMLRWPTVFVLGIVWCLQLLNGVALAKDQKGAVAPGYEEVCSDPKKPYFDCARLVTEALNKLPSNLEDPGPLFKIASTWDQRFEKEYHMFASANGRSTSQSDYDKIKEEIGGHISPDEILKEKGKEKIKSWLVKRFKQLATIVAFLHNKIITLGSATLGAFLTPSEIATSWDERRLTNVVIQEQLTNRLMPLYLKDNWRQRFELQVGPVLEKITMPKP